MDRFFSRREKIRETLEADGIDALLVSAPTNVSYLTGFTGDSSVLVVSRERDLIVSDGRFTIQLEEECPGLEVRIRETGEDMNPAIARVMELMRLRQVGFEASSWTVGDFESIRALAPAAELVGTRGRVEALRQIKDDGEVLAIREAISSAERAFAMLRAGLKRGESEKDTADLLEGYLRRCGATAASFPPIVAVGAQLGPPAREADDDNRNR